MSLSCLLFSAFEVLVVGGVVVVLAVGLSCLSLELIPRG